VTTPNADTLRETLVSDLLRIGKIRSPRIAEAFRAVPRHLFVPDAAVEAAYEDDVIFTKSRDGVSVSALPSPSISADMLEVLDVRPGQAVLEIGAGTGYNAALLAELAAPGGRVVTIDIDQDIVDAAVANLRAAGRLDRVHVYCADGGFGRAEEAPYDRVLVTVGAWDVPPPWVDQLVVGGRLVVPIEIHDVHKLIAFERRPDQLASVDVRDCRFVRMRGAFAGSDQQVPLAATGIYLSTSRPELANERVAEALREPAVRTAPLPIALDPEDLLGSFRLWLALRTNDFCLLSVEGDALRESSIRGWSKGSAAFASAPGVLCDDAVCLVERDAEEQPILRSYGGIAGEPERRLGELLSEWDDAGRPFTSGLRVEANRLGAGARDRSTGYVVERRWHRYVFIPL
jgi:protein-L-isoaspartate(D-aspartate) O-methyltransferase